MIRVLFVCLGNICRSPMAEAVFRHKVKQAGLEGLIEADSAGTAGWHAGSPPHEGTRRVLDRQGIGWQGLAARQVRPEDADRFDYIVAMDEANVRDLRRLIGEGRDRPLIAKMLDFHPSPALRDVPDPYYTGNFEETYELVEASCAGLLDYICEREGIRR